MITRLYWKCSQRTTWAPDLWPVGQDSGFDRRAPALLRGWHQRLCWSASCWCFTLGFPLCRARWRDAGGHGQPTGTVPLLEAYLGKGPVHSWLCCILSQPTRSWLVTGFTLLCLETGCIIRTYCHEIPSGCYRPVDLMRFVLAKHVRISI